MNHYFNKQDEQTKELEYIYENAINNRWSVERAFAEYRVLMYSRLNLSDANKLIARNALKKLREKDDNSYHEEDIEEIWRHIDALSNTYLELFEELRDMVPSNVKGNDIYKTMYTLLKEHRRDIWEELQ
jgi:hypothetical protein